MKISKLIILSSCVAAVVSCSFLSNLRKSDYEKSLIETIPNLAAWFEPTASGNLTNLDGKRKISNGDLIGSWNNHNPTVKNSQYNDATQDLRISSPSYEKSAINDLPALYFNGGSCLAINSKILASDYSVFAVIKTNSVNGPKRGKGNPYLGVGIVSGDVAGNAEDVIPLGLVAGYVKVGIGSKESYVALPEEKMTFVADNKPHILFSSLSTDKKSVRLAVDSIETSESLYEDGSLKAANHAYIGCVNMDNDNNRFVGHIAEVIIYSRVLRDEERENVMKYLGKKWDIEVKE